MSDFRGFEPQILFSTVSPPKFSSPCSYQVMFSRKFASVRQRVTVLTDERVKLTNQAVTGARLMKMNAWEPALEAEIRRQETQAISLGA